MSNFPWEAFTDRGNLASTVLDSLGDDTLSGASTELDNSNNLDPHAFVEINLGSLNPTGIPLLQLYMIRAPDGTNYEEAPIIDGTNRNTLIGTIPVPTGSAAKRVISNMIMLPPFKVKFYVGNKLNVSTAGSGNTLDVYTGRLANV
jgi:hypothetical protein